MMALSPESRSQQHVFCAQREPRGHVGHLQCCKPRCPRPAPQAQCRAQGSRAHDIQGAPALPPPASEGQRLPRLRRRTAPRLSVAQKPMK